jgi:ribosome maturation factor RimP
MDRPLYTADQFARYLDSVIRVRLRSTVEGRKNYRGCLLEAGPRQLKMLVDGETVTLAMDDIDTARVVPQF